MRTKQQGFTLIEIILVLAIISVLLYLGMGYYQQQVVNSRIDRTSLQMQQILNAGLAYYVANGQWPGSENTSSLTALIKQGYLPETPTPPWPNVTSYNASPNNTNTAQAPLFMVTLTLPSTQPNAASWAQVIAGKLPLAYTSLDVSSIPPDVKQPCLANTEGDNAACIVVSQVNIPGQNLNNAMAMNFAGLYHHSACVPAPVCPATAPNGQPMHPEIFLVPVSVNAVTFPSGGMNPSTLTTLNGFTAYAVGDGTTAQNPVTLNYQIGDWVGPLYCGPADKPSKILYGGTLPCGNVSDPAGTKYWRACLQVITGAGDMQYISGQNGWGQFATMAAFTRCAITNEPSGSPPGVYSN